MRHHARVLTGRPAEKQTAAYRLRQRRVRPDIPFEDFEGLTYGGCTPEGTAAGAGTLQIGHTTFALPSRYAPQTERSQLCTCPGCAANDPSLTPQDTAVGLGGENKDT